MKLVADQIYSGKRWELCTNGRFIIWCELEEVMESGECGSGQWISLPHWRLQKEFFLSVIHSLFFSFSILPYFSSIRLSSFNLPLFSFHSNSTLSILFILSPACLISLSCLFSGCRCSAKWWNLRWITFFRHFPRRRMSAACRKSLCCSAALGSAQSTDVCVHAGTSVKDK